MSRVTPGEVSEIVETVLLDPVIQVWIDAANTIVTGASSCIGGDDALLAQVELYLAAHFIAINDISSGATVKSDKIDNQATTYSVVELQGNINDSSYGRAANMLSNGCLLTIGQEAATVEFF